MKYFGSLQHLPISKSARLWSRSARQYRPFLWLTHLRWQNHWLFPNKVDWYFFVFIETHMFVWNGYHTKRFNRSTRGLYFYPHIFWDNSITKRRCRYEIEWSTCTYCCRNSETVCHIIYLLECGVSFSLDIIISHERYISSILKRLFSRGILKRVFSREYPRETTPRENSREIQRLIGQC